MTSCRTTAPMAHVMLQARDDFAELGVLRVDTEIALRSLGVDPELVLIDLQEEEDLDEY